MHISRNILFWVGSRTLWKYCIYRSRFRKSEFYLAIIFFVHRDDKKFVPTEKSKKMDGALLAVAVIFGIFGALVLGFMIYIIHRVKYRHLYMQVNLQLLLMRVRKILL